MTVISSVITTTGAGTLILPSDCPPGTILTVEGWGGGSGGSGTGSTNGGGGGGGAYASSAYTVTPNDALNGIAYAVGTGGNGNTGTGSVGVDTSFSTNNLNLISNAGGGNNINTGAVAGTPGTYPTNWWLSGAAGLTSSISGFGTDPATGLPYIDINLVGTTSGTSTAVFFSTNVAYLISSALQYTLSAYVGLASGAVTNITNITLGWDAYNGVTYQSSAASSPFTPTSTITRQSVTFTNPASNTLSSIYLNITYSSGVSIDVRLRIAGVQFEQAAAASFVKTAPGYTLAKGGAAPITTSGGVGGTTAASVGTTATFAGGNGRAYNAAGSGGGGSAGKDGAGATATTLTGGTGDNGSGGAANTANVEGGGGGTASTANGGTGTAGGAPGGGGGGSDGNSGTRTGGAGARGQLRVAYTAQSFPTDHFNLSQNQPILAQ